MLTIAPARHVLLPLANLVTDDSVKAMERKIERGNWSEDNVWRPRRTDRILIDLVVEAPLRLAKAWVAVDA